jgi:SAM-dependent methyltransferase
MESQFYDQLSAFYHLIYVDWEGSIIRQSNNLESIIQEFWGDQIKTVLDVSCGIGTQTIGLAQKGFQLTASDLSASSIDRAKQEALKRDLKIDFSVADMREAHDHHGNSYDLIICCDNSIPHLLSDADILKAFEQFYQCIRPGGGCLISVRDYAAMNLQGVQVHPYGTRVENNCRYLIFQVWEFQGSVYDLSMYFVKDDGSANCQTTVLRSKYYAITIDRLIELLIKAGFEQVKRLDDRFFQPIIIGSRPGKK